MPELYYTAVIKDGAVYKETDANGKEFVYAEHFEDAAERDKRARQFLTCAPAGSALYSDTIPPEAYMVRHQYLVDHPQTEDMTQKQRDDIMTAALIAGDKAGAKTVSKLTAPEVDDSKEARALPDWAAASHAVDAARQAVKDAEASVMALQNRADVLKAEATDSAADSLTPEVKGALRRKANEVQLEADQASARLYHAQNDLSEKIAAYEKIKPKEGKKNA